MEQAIRTLSTESVFKGANPRPQGVRGEIGVATFAIGS
jgi:hypothetical protein